MATDWWQLNAPPMADYNADNATFKQPTFPPGYGGNTGVTGGMLPYQPALPGQPGGYPMPNLPGMPGYTGAPVLTGHGESVPDDFGGPQNGDYQGWFNKLIAGKPYNQQTLLQLEPILNKYGIQLTPPNAAGERTKINIPGMGWVRVGFGEGRPVWIPQGAGGGAAGGGGGGRFDPGTMAGGIQPYQAPTFTPPSGLTMENDPGFLARMRLGTQAIEESAAAKGGLLSGGTLKALDQYAQDYGSSEYGNVFNRALTTAGYNAGQGQQGYLNRYGQYQDWANWQQQNMNRGMQAGQSLYRPPTT